VPRFKDKVFLAWAGARRTAPALQWRMLLDMADNWQRPRFPLTGMDVMQAGVEQGPDVGRLLARVEDWWIGTDFAADEGALRDKLREVLRDGA
jgi:poly(A) polymerase